MSATQEGLKSPIRGSSHGKGQASSSRNLVGDTPIYASKAMFTDISLSCGTYSVHGRKLDSGMLSCGPELFLPTQVPIQTTLPRNMVRVT